MNKPDMTIQKARGARMLVRSIAGIVLGVALLVLSFITYAYYSNFFVSGSLLFVGTLFMGVASHRLNKALSLLENARYGIIIF